MRLMQCTSPPTLHLITPPSIHCFFVYKYKWPLSTMSSQLFTPKRASFSAYHLFSFHCQNQVEIAAHLLSMVIVFLLCKCMCVGCWLAFHFFIEPKEIKVAQGVSFVLTKRIYEYVHQSNYAEAKLWSSRVIFCILSILYNRYCKGLLILLIGKKYQILKFWPSMLGCIIKENKEEWKWDLGLGIPTNKT